MPILQGILTTSATKLTKFENYETHGAYEQALTQKIFVLNFITSYLPILLTAFVYVPFGTIIVPYLDVFSLAVKPFAENGKQLEVTDTFAINPARLRKQVIYFTVTAQIVNLGMEVIVPYLKRQGFIKYKQMQSDRAAKNGGATPDPSVNDSPEEAAFLSRVRSEAELGVYDVTTDLREMVLQVRLPHIFVQSRHPYQINTNQPLVRLPLPLLCRLASHRRLLPPKRLARTPRRRPQNLHRDAAPDPLAR
jgi:hypothetical protein